MSKNINIIVSPKRWHGPCQTSTVRASTQKPFFINFHNSQKVARSVPKGHGLRQCAGTNFKSFFQLFFYFLMLPSISHYLNNIINHIISHQFTHSMMFSSSVPGHLKSCKQSRVKGNLEGQCTYCLTRISEISSNIHITYINNIVKRNLRSTNCALNPKMTKKGCEEHTCISILQFTFF